MKIALTFSLLLIFFGNLLVYGLQHDEESVKTHQIQITQNSYNRGCEVTESCYLPSEIHIKQGETVSWINIDDALHTITSGDPSKGPNDIFDSGLLKTDQIFSYTFNDNNTSYSYYCTLHPWMIGYIAVGDTELKIQSEIPEKIPTIFDNNFKIEKFVSGIKVPTTMIFVDNDILTLQKNDGKIRLIRNGTLQDNPVLDVEVSNYGEQGLLGITSTNSDVYLFLTEAFHDGGLHLGNRIYKYTWDGKNLANPVLIKELPATTQTYIGGVMASDVKGNVYTILGEQYRAGILQNHLPFESYRHFSSNASPKPEHHVGFFESLEYTLSCLNVSLHHYTTNPPGWQMSTEKVNDNPWETNVFFIFGNIESCLKQFSYNNFSSGHWKDTSIILQVEPQIEYIAMGIRNSFGLAIDPITGYLWDTENGPVNFDEINLVIPKFNSGWAKIMGPAKQITLEKMPGYEEFVYSDPEFSWENTVAPTGITFLDSKGGHNYENSLIVGACNGNLYKFNLNSERTGFIFNNDELKDLVLNKDDSVDELLLGKNFGCITDVKTGPDGSLYIVSLTHGVIYKIIPKQ